jgi:hypothetical protein
MKQLQFENISDDSFLFDAEIDPSIGEITNIRLVLVHDLVIRWMIIEYMKDLSRRFVRYRR